jgi:hypothetical protein
MTTAALILLLCLLVLGYPALSRYREQQRRFASAIAAEPEPMRFVDPPRSRASTRSDEGMPARAEARRSLAEARLELVALRGRLEVALSASDERVELLLEEVAAAQTALRNIAASLDQAASGLALRPAGAMPDLPRELPTSMQFGPTEMPATSYARYEALEGAQREAVRGQLTLALEQAVALDGRRERLQAELDA